MANADTHPWTYAIQFDACNSNGLISMEGFRTLLENTYALRLAKAKRPSYIRSRAWLDAIVRCDASPPAGYTSSAASWKHEIGFTNPATSKWVCRDGKVYNKTGKNTDAPHTPAEELYRLMISVHNDVGHLGRDNFYNKVQQSSVTPTKDFCNSFINSCCPKASLWIDGGLVNYHQLPIANPRAAGRASPIPAPTPAFAPAPAPAPAPVPTPANVAPEMDAPVNNPPSYNNGEAVLNGLPWDNTLSFDRWVPISNVAPIDNGMFTPIGAFPGMVAGPSSDPIGLGGDMDMTPPESMEVDDWQYASDELSFDFGAPAANTEHGNLASPQSIPGYDGGNWGFGANDQPSGPHRDEHLISLGQEMAFAVQEFLKECELEYADLDIDMDANLAISLNFDTDIAMEEVDNGTLDEPADKNYDDPADDDNSWREFLA